MGSLLTYFDGPEVLPQFGVQAMCRFETVRPRWSRAQARQAAKRRYSLAWGVSPRILDVTPCGAAKRRQDVSAQDKPLVVVHAMPLEQLDEFLAVASCEVCMEWWLSVAASRLGLLGLPNLGLTPQANT